MKRLLGYTYTTIFLPGTNKTTLYNYFSDLQHHPFARSAAATTSSINPYLLHPADSKKWKPLQLDLLNGEKFIGRWILLYGAQETVSETCLESLPGFAELIAATLTNSIDYEEMLDREKENDIIQSLNIDFATIRQKQDLLKVIHFKLKNLFDFSDQFVAVINDDKLTLSSFLQDTQSWADEHPKYKQSVAAKYPLNDGVFNKVILSKDPQVFDLRQQHARGNMPEYFQILYDSGVRMVFMVGLHVRDRMIGLWCICQVDGQHMSSGQLQLIRKISVQLSIAVENIKANEAIAAKEEEGRLLLRMSDDIANIHDLIKRYKQQLEEKKIYLEEEIGTTHNYAEIIGNGPEMQKVFRLVSKVAGTDSTVLILGETGTGKELIARAIHNNSSRKERIMVKVNCATLPVHLVESELFGHERGSFTGAIERRIGKFELANHGTLFLDEIGELPPELQVKLLRALQEKEIERIGGKTTIKVDVRIIAATNRDIEKEVAEGRFRNDLYYRLNIFPICLPPLRSRTEDIPVLAAHFMQRFSKKLGKQINKISHSKLQELLQYSWPGNIRELEHLVERSILLTTGDTITDIPLPSPRQQNVSQPAQVYFSLKTIDENEREHILNTLIYCKGKITGEGGAAQRLGVPNSTLSSKMKRLGIRKEHFK
ncbi:sigma-54 interaction domain-containing protein [Chitinophaga agrisoli]|uniref:sigma-54 interaction domain-containing protein n=1 Tax=Chitinophaga agrisoli TaxID=2607653 RepID=UPI001661ED38|nr:sigma 54-interacting transcriptional regulator [Chitinophaga agrisoli]